MTHTTKVTHTTEQIQILNAAIDNLSLDSLLEQLVSGGTVFTPNVDHLVKLQQDQEFYQVYRAADYCVCDSKILMYISRFLGAPVQEKISGSDLFPAFCRRYRKDPSICIFLLGAAPGIAEKAKVRINQKAGRDIVVDTYSPPRGFEHDADECDKIIDLVNASKATVLAVGVGAPKQEKWIANHKHKLDHVRIFMAVGATIDFEAGHVRRAPAWVSEVGLEWLYRLLSEPKRLWKRYLVESMPFFWLVLQQRLKLYRDPFSFD